MTAPAGGGTNFRPTPGHAQICVETIVARGKRLEREQT